MSSVAYCAEEVDPSLVKLPMNFNSSLAKFGLTNCGLVMLYCNGDLGQYWFR